MIPQKIAIISHKTPDGDAIGSMIGSYHLILDNLGVESVMILDDTIPEDFGFLAAANKIQSAGHISADYVPDIAIALDAAQFYRLGAAGEIFNRAKRKIKIDHHKDGEPYGGKNIVHIRSSVSEILTDMAVRLKWKISSKAANALATGIFMDTNKLSVNLEPAMFSALSRLIQAGANLEKIRLETGMQRKNIFQAVSYLGTQAKFEFNGKLVYCVISDEDYKKYNMSFQEIKGGPLLLNLQSIREADVALIFYATKDGSYISMRGKNGVVVRHIGEAIGGKGHDFAIGVDVPGIRPNDMVKKVLGLFKENIFSTR
jgi:phosphoesterase RecJ-like protein